MLSIGTLMLLGACATPADPTQWIRIGSTTRDEVVEQYGEPDMVLASTEGEIAIYRPRTSGESAARLEIPTAQTGPFGTATTNARPLNPGLGARSIGAGVRDRPNQELHIRYDSRGIVQAVIP